MGDPESQAWRPTIAVIGGTGALGSSLARRWAEAGFPVVIGSREAERAIAGAALIALPGILPPVRGCSQADAARVAEVIVLTVPFAAHAATLEAIRPFCRGKLVVDATVPLMPPKVGTAQIPPAGSAAVQARERLGGEATVVSAFHTVSAGKLAGAAPVTSDVLVFGDDRAARQLVIRLVAGVGLRGVHGGPLANSIAAEAMTSVLISINRIYKVEGSGIRIVGLENAGERG